jgi:RNase adapter protein RapZ
VTRPLLDPPGGGSAPGPDFGADAAAIPATGAIPVVAAEDAAGPPELLVITGMSGAGRSTAAKALEDLGWYVVDNLPPQLIPRLAGLTAQARPVVRRIAVAVDVRGRSFFSAVNDAVDTARQEGVRTRTLFLDATDDTLVRRFESVRRPHPLQASGTLLDGIVRERALLGDLRAHADTVIDTSRLNVHELSRKVAAVFGDEATPSIRLVLMSFGFKYGLPLDADLVVDARFLPNPHWLPELRPRTGQDPEVRDYVLGQEDAGAFLDRYTDVLELLIPGYRREGKRYLTLAVGCTGGKHRSVAIAEEFARRLRADGIDAAVQHRDLGRE